MNKNLLLIGLIIAVLLFASAPAIQWEMMGATVPFDDGVNKGVKKEIGTLPNNDFQYRWCPTFGYSYWEKGGTYYTHYRLEIKCNDEPTFSDGTLEMVNHCVAVTLRTAGTACDGTLYLMNEPWQTPPAGTPLGFDHEVTLDDGTIANVGTEEGSQVVAEAVNPDYVAPAQSQGGLLEWFNGLFDGLRQWFSTVFGL